ncbi:MAG TPA: aspartate aminotransferase family protein [Phycisphaerae bacterium]|nr:aspartate aminotransferase family protein [Phycisphaerae bacterium]
MKFEKSKQLWERASKTCPGGIHSNVRKAWQPHPMFYERGEGSHVWDVDGNEFIDYVLARGPLLLGHSPKPVLDAVKAQLDRGLMYAGQHELEIQASEKFCSLVPCAEMVRFSGSGSEATHAAMRLARAVTGRTKILRFEGHYHGWFDNQMWNFAPPLDKAGPREAPVPLPATAGQNPNEADHLVIRPWNDLTLVEEAFRQNPGQIAGVITEPVMCNTGGILPKPGFLEGLRDLCTAHGALLIFDEVITGFRVSLGGAQQYFRVTPDLATFAKGMAGGFPVSAIAGKRQYMQAFGDLTVTHAGTYNSSAPYMAATLAAMNMLSADDGALLKHAHDMGRQLMDGIREAGRRAGKDVHVRGVGTVFHVSFNDKEEIVDYRTSLGKDAAAYDRFWLALQDRGIRTVPGGLWFVSTAHTPQDVQQTLDAVAEAIKLV